MNISTSYNVFGIKKGILMLRGSAIGTVTRKMVFQRAVELAAINGSSYHAISKSDWEQAKRELTGQPEIDPGQALLKSAPESDRWDPIHGSTGSTAPESPSEDEDSDGYSDSARMIEDGMNEASHDQMLAASKKKYQ